MLNGSCAEPKDHFRSCQQPSYITVLVCFKYC